MDNATTHGQADRDTGALRLPDTFHETFPPERPYLRAILNLAAERQQGTREEIQVATGIPTGEGSGKVVPHIRYAAGMGLLWDERQGNRYAPRLTPLGEVVLAEDRSLDEAFTQWLVHLFLCRRRGGGGPWYALFGRGATLLGNRFRRNELERWWTHAHSNPRLPPFTGMYSRDDSFRRASILTGFEEKTSESGNTTTTWETFERQPAPRPWYFAAGLAYWLLDQWLAAFPNRVQLSLAELTTASDFVAIAAWSEAETAEALARMAEIGALRVEHQLADMVLTRLVEPASLLLRLYRDLP